eukprot:m.142343 g.142343  ORF g.142343 m.142343 type:complete len:397 (-) comp14877_c0_seq4:3841-5031(-)
MKVFPFVCLAVVVRSAVVPRETVSYSASDDVWYYHRDQEAGGNRPPQDALINETMGSFMWTRHGRWAFMGRKEAFTFDIAESDVTVPYRLTFETLQHPENSVQNEPRGNTVPMDFSIAIVQQTTPPNNIDDLWSLAWSCAYSHTLNRWTQFGEENCRTILLRDSEGEYTRVIDVSESGTSSTSQYHTTVIDFTVTDRCTNCTILLFADMTNWISYWGSIVYVKNMVLERRELTIPDRLIVDGSHERVLLPKPTSIPQPTQTDCPHTQAGLQLWQSAGTWPSGQVPTPSDQVIELPAATKVLVNSNSFTGTSANPYYLIVVPDTSELIFADESISLHVSELRVHGSLRIGSATCRLNSAISITFYGDINYERCGSCSSIIGCCWSLIKRARCYQRKS